MKIGILCFPTYGGSGFIATELGQYLARQGHQIHFITYSLPRRLLEPFPKINYHEVSTHVYPPFEHPLYTLALTSKIVEIHQSKGLDLLHVHYAIPHAVAAYMAREILKKEGKTLPFITTLHGTDITITGQNPAYKPLVSLSLQESNIITAVSHSLKKETQKYFQTPAPIHVIPNFVDLKRFDRPIQSAMNKGPNNVKLILHISTLRKVKRVLDVIDIFARIRRQESANLYVVGHGPMRSRMEKRAQELGIQEAVTFLGNIDAVETLLHQADLLLLPSEKESFGLAVLEAMAAGVPAVTSDAGGLPELIIHGKNGYVCPLGDVETMAKCALIALSKDQLPKLRKAAKERAKNFDMARVATLYIEKYESIVGTSTRHAKQT